MPAAETRCLQTYSQMRAQRDAFAALPYRLSYEHWGMSAWSGGGWGNPGTLLAQVSFPVSTRGPYDPPEVRDRLFAELDAAALAAIAAAEGRA